MKTSPSSVCRRFAASVHIKDFVSKYWRGMVLVVLAAVVFCFWLLLYPFIPVVREMSQLFLWTGDYFLERLRIPGGLAQYIGEMICQMFINPVNGAIGYTMIFVAAQQLSSKWLRLFFSTHKTSIEREKVRPKANAVWQWGLSFVLPVILWWVAMSPEIPLTLTVAILIVMGVGCVIMNISQKGGSRKGLWAVVVSIPVMYWFTGPAAILLVLCSIRWAAVTVTLFAACLMGSSYLAPYPLRQVAMGIDYIVYDRGVDKPMGTYEEMECDMLLRQRKWRKIIERFQHPVSPAVCSAVVLANHKIGRTGRKELLDNLVVPAELQGSVSSVFNIGDRCFVVNFGSLSSAFMVSDMAIELYWTNMAQRTAFEAMEYIPNYNKSGRALKRLVETNIISGHYDVARKYISILEKTTFYRKWAKSMLQLIDHPKLIKKNSFIHAAQESYANTEDVFFI